jgi:hypothetical protein
MQQPWRTTQPVKGREGIVTVFDFPNVAIQRAWLIFALSE